MHCVYRFTFNKRLALGLRPYLYIGSKSNCAVENDVLVDKHGNAYYGSSRYPGYDSLIEEDNISVEILFQTNRYEKVLEAERNFQIAYDVVASLDYFNLSLAQRSSYSDPNYATYKHVSGDKCVRLPRNHPMVLSGEYVGVTKGITLSETTKSKIGRSGDANPFYGKKHSDNTKRVIGEKNSKRIKTSEEIANWVEKVAKRPLSIEHKKKISDKNKNMIMLKNVTTGESIKINKNDVDLYDKALWKNPAAISQRRETCVYCGVTSVAGNIKRWHNENCKEKK